MTQERTDADVAFIQALAELLNANDLTELSVKREYGPDDRLDVKVSKHAAPVNMRPPPLLPQHPQRLPHPKTPPNTPAP
jgi:acetyl-CoA carboxylase biotin carboxyl carrier protein